MKYITKERVGLALILVALLTNPLTGQYALDGVNRAWQAAFTYAGTPVTLAAASYIIGYMLWSNYKSGRTNVPKKTAKTKAQRYIEA